MKLETAESLSFAQVTEAQLLEAFREDLRRGEFIILSQQPEIYIQASGENEGPYRLEYRERAADHHFYAAGDYRKEDVQRAFQWYLAGDSRWQTEFPWKKEERKPWWKIW